MSNSTPEIQQYLTELLKQTKGKELSWRRINPLAYDLVKNTESGPARAVLQRASSGSSCVLTVMNTSKPDQRLMIRAANGEPEYQILSEIFKALEINRQESGLDLLKGIISAK